MYIFLMTMFFIIFIHILIIEQYLKRINQCIENIYWYIQEQNYHRGVYNENIKK